MALWRAARVAFGGERFDERGLVGKGEDCDQRPDLLMHRKGVACESQERRLHKRAVSLVSRFIEKARRSHSSHRRARRVADVDLCSAEQPAENHQNAGMDFVPPRGLVDRLAKPPSGFARLGVAAVRVDAHALRFIGDLATWLPRPSISSSSSGCADRTHRPCPRDCSSSSGSSSTRTAGGGPCPRRRRILQAAGFRRASSALELHFFGGNLSSSASRLANRSKRYRDRLRPAMATVRRVHLSTALAVAASARLANRAG